MPKNNEELIKKILSYKWERWLERPFAAFVQSLFEDSTREETYEKLGFPGISLRGMLFQNRFWYLNSDLLEEMDRQIEEYLKTHTIFDITRVLDTFKAERQKELVFLAESPLSIEERFGKVFEALTFCCSFIWLAHGLESYYQRRLDEEVPKYITGDIQKFIGDASFPLKKNEHALMEDMMRSNASDEEIATQFGWLKCRDGFNDPFTAADVQQMRGELAPMQTHNAIEVPEPLRDLISQVQELIYYRTARTDVFFQIFYAARSIIKERGQTLGIPFAEIKYYRSKSLIQGHLEKYSASHAFAYLDGEVLFQDDPIIVEEVTTQVTEFKGSIAYKGVVRGIVKVVKEASEMGKVELGDILVTQMTFPSFIPAMIRASAFVTDEGGITCHAAIVAREMKKPCVIGTKVATKVLKDGDMVEVDADKGIVRII